MHSHFSRRSLHAVSVFQLACTRIGALVHWCQILSLVHCVRSFHWCIVSDPFIGALCQILSPHHLRLPLIELVPVIAPAVRAVSRTLGQRVEKREIERWSEDGSEDWSEDCSEGAKQKHVLAMLQVKASGQKSTTKHPWFLRGAGVFFCPYETRAITMRRRV